MERLIQQHPLRHGAHPTREDGMCAMEMVAWLAGEPHSDEPRCACPVIAAFVRACNDALPSDQARDRQLRPLVPQLVNTKGSAALERARGLLVVDALVRRLLPQALLRLHRHDEAVLLGALPAIVDDDALRAALRAVETYAPQQHAARWVLQRAVEGAPPARYVAGAVQVVRRLGDPAAWSVAVATVQAMAQLGRASLAAPAEG